MNLKLENILGIILVAVLIIGGTLYFKATRNSTNVCLAGESCDEKTVKDEQKSAVIKITSTDQVESLADKKKAYKLAPEIINPSGFVNTNGAPITLGEFKGKKVVLVDFWTYTCINCQRTLPYLNEWYKKYQDVGLEIVSIHTPEFAFEKLLKNVESAAERFGVKYPIVLDNNYGTWNAFGNQYWPRKYLVDIDGFIVYDHIGEGAYDETERAIQKALLERKERLNEEMDITTTISDPSTKITVDTGKLGSPETYFGSARNEYLTNGKEGVAGEQILIVPTNARTNGLYLGGVWNITPEYAENKGEATIVYKYQAKSVYIVASSLNGGEIEVTLDGVAPAAAAGADINSATGAGLIKEERLYKIIEDKNYGEHTLIIKIKNPGLRAFAFTFG